MFCKEQIQKKMHQNNERLFMYSGMKWECVMSMTEREMGADGEREREKASFMIDRHGWHFRIHFAWYTSCGVAWCRQRNKSRSAGAVSTAYYIRDDK